MSGNGELDSYLDSLVEGLQGLLGDDLVGVYLHGSLALGGFIPGKSDVDVLAVTSRSLSREERLSLSEAISHRSLPCPGGGLELHVVHRDQLEDLADAHRFEVYMQTGATRAKDDVNVGSNPNDPSGGDPDLWLHFYVLRQAGRALVGPAPQEIFPSVSRPKLLEMMLRELEWAAQNGSPEYQVLTACRVWYYLDQGSACSKIAGGEWARQRVEHRELIDAALQRQRGNPVEIDEAEAATLRQRVEDRVRDTARVA